MFFLPAYAGDYFDFEHFVINNLYYLIILDIYLDFSVFFSV